MTAWVRMKCGTSAKVAVSGPMSTSESRSYSSIAKRLLDQFLVAPGADHGPERLPRARGDDQPWARRVVGARVAGDRHRLLARGQQERVGVRDQVDEVVGVDMRDHDRVDVGVVDRLAQLPEHAAAAVE